MSDSSISFEPLADVYDATRGGIDRGKRFADDLAPWLDRRPGAILDLGIGTGAVALPLHLRVERPVVGVDLAPSMLARATGRLGPGLVAVADAARLPLPAQSVGDAVAVWLLQAAGDRQAVLREVERVLPSGGRLVAVLARPERRPSDLDDALPSWHVLLGRADGDDPERIAAVAAGAGLRLVDQALTAWQEWESSPHDEVERITGRTYGPLLDLDAATWAAKVQPVVDRLLALPDPAAPRQRASRHSILVFEKP